MFLGVGEGVIDSVEFFFQGNNYFIWLLLESSIFWNSGRGGALCGDIKLKTHQSHKIRKKMTD